MKVVVAGGTGVLGQRICSEVRSVSPDAELLIGTRRVGGAAGLARDLGPPARSVPLDVRDPASIRRVADGADVVIVAVAQDAPLVQQVCLDLGVHSVDVGVGADVAEQVRAMDRQAVDAGLAAVAMAGLFPGLSGLLVREVVGGLDTIESVDVFFRQHTNARVGRAGTTDMLRIVSTPVRRGTSVVRGFLRGSHAEPGSRLIEHPERSIMTSALGPARVDYWTRWNSRTFDAVVATLVAVRALPRFASQIARLTRHDPDIPENVELRVLGRGALAGRPAEQVVTLSALSDYGATAGVAVALSMLAVRRKITGAGVPFALTTLDEVLAAMRDGLVTVRGG
ncbi:Saccharopine dehydrogenase [Actinoalloteichus sp. GBA129-24]|uniref:Saccharopine dehydrogenase n=2 Tax=Pseudonocardiaceae TaxID=2070 RepID=A0AAC9PQB2_9PSEU|nr:Saccharopine dehydrogenase [Actinoalloteichus fjordicus]APU18728.1 Saccharopine dehydrogenase [Actinoalloteichus sp. GBA129-24]